MANLSKLIPAPARGSINTGLSAARNDTWLRVFGAPRKIKTHDCSPVTNPVLRRLIVTASVGPFRVTGLRPAVELLAKVMQEIREHQPQAYREVRTAGMLCCRLVRGSSSTWSNHAFGGAVDLYFGDTIDEMGDGKVQQGLLTIYPYFRTHGFFWGAGYNTREDGMHFELADETIWKLVKAGKFK